MALIDNKAQLIALSKARVASLTANGLNATTGLLIASIETCQIASDSDAEKILSYLFQAGKLAQTVPPPIV